MSACTPGPWRIKGRTRSTGEFIRIESRHPAKHLYQVADVIAANDYPENEANARLIAAAPDLLEACKTFAEWLRREENGFVKTGNERSTPEGEAAWREWFHENMRICDLAQEQVRAAIAKATGGES
jgi:hypothetical protein